MDVVIAKSVAEVEAVRGLAVEWKETCDCKEFGIETDVDVFLAGLMDLVDGSNTDLLLLERDNEIVGLMGITLFKSPVSSDTIANEHFWYVKQEHRGKGSLMLLARAKAWAKIKGCSYLIMNASNAASDMHDKVCRFYERAGLKKFETSYIKEIV